MIIMNHCCVSVRLCYGTIGIPNLSIKSYTQTAFNDSLIIDLCFQETIE